MSHIKCFVGYVLQKRNVFNLSCWYNGVEKWRKLWDVFFVVVLFYIKNFDALLCLQYYLFPRHTGADGLHYTERIWPKSYDFGVWLEKHWSKSQCIQPIINIIDDQKQVVKAATDQSFSLILSSRFRLKKTCITHHFQVGQWWTRWSPAATNCHTGKHSLRTISLKKPNLHTGSEHSN